MKKHEESAHDTSSQEVELDEDALTRSIIGVFYKVFKGLKSGLPERIYVGALQIELEALGFTVAREVAIDVWYAGHRLGAYRVDLLVD